MLGKDRCTLNIDDYLNLVNQIKVIHHYDLELVRADCVVIRRYCTVYGYMLVNILFNAYIYCIVLFYASSFADINGRLDREQLNREPRINVSGILNVSIVRCKLYQQSGNSKELRHTVW